MKYPRRIYSSEADKALMRDRRQKGESLPSIAGHLGRSPTAMWNTFARTGRIRPAPAVVIWFQRLAVRG